MPQTMLLSEHLQQIMTTLDISHADLARMLGISDRTVMRWLADEMYPQHDSRRKLDQLDVLVQRLDDSFTTPQGTVSWLHSPSGYFGGLRPIDALLLGRIDAVDAALEALDAGVFV